MSPRSNSSLSILSQGFVKYKGFLIKKRCYREQVMRKSYDNIVSISRTGKDL